MKNTSSLSARICKALAKFGPLTKEDLVKKLRLKSSPGAKAGYNISRYFANVSPNAKAAYHANPSLVSSGHVTQVGKEGRSAVYGLTAKGLILAAE